MTRTVPGSGAQIIPIFNSVSGGKGRLCDQWW